jgi:DNA-binding LytR/AlgR family response regulator
VIWKELLFLPWILFTVGLGNLLYSSWTLGFHLTLTNILIFQTYTLAIGIIPITTLTLVKQNFLKRKNEENAEIISETIYEHKPEKVPGRQVQIFSDNEKDHLTVHVDDLLYIKSDGNYITVGFIKDRKPARALLRNTMKYAVELLVPFSFIFQCHRSWMINLHRIKNVTGNSQGLRLMLDGFEEDIPVARTNMTAFKRLMVERET